MGTELRLALLGTPQIWLDGKVVQGFRTVKTQALFYYLAATRQVHARAALATLLWGDMPERNAHVSLSKSLSNLRDLFPDHLEIDRNLVALNQRARYWLDVTAFETGCASFLSTSTSPSSEPDLQRLRQVADHYGGDFLAGFAASNAPDFDLWQNAEAQRLRELAILAYDRLAAGYAARGEWGEAIASYRKILTMEPWREEVHRQLMRLLVASGQRSAALLQYELCVRTLADELAVEPEEATSELYEHIVGGSSAGDDSAGPAHGGIRSAEVVSTPGNASPPLSQRLRSLVGRTEELGMLRRLLSKGHRLITLLGPGGVGKTSLAFACAEAMLTDFRDGVWYLTFASVDFHSPDGSIDDSIAASTDMANDMAEAKAFAMLADKLQITLQGPLSAEEQVANFLHNKELLLVLDNFDPFVRVAQLLTRLLAKAPRLRLLVTSREALYLQDEYMFPVGFLPVPEATLVRGSKNEAYLAHLSSFAAVTLFVQCARRVQNDFRLSLANADAVAEICRNVEGLPLGIELAATWLDTLTVDEIAEELANNLDLLDAPPLQLAQQPDGIRAVFERSWQLLSQQERQCAAYFAIFQGGANREAALWITEAALPHLSALVSKSMLRRNVDGRYAMHELLRHYCAEKLASEYPVTSAYSRHSTYYLTLVQEREKIIKRKDAKPTIQEMRLEIDNIRQAWRWAVEQGDFAILQRALSGYARLYSLVGLYEEACATLEWSVNQLHTLVDTIPERQEAHRQVCELCSGILSHAAAFHNRRALFDRAIVLSQAAERFVQNSTLPVSRGHALLRRGEAYWYQGHMTEAAPLLEQVLECTRLASPLAVDPQEYQADTLCIQGSIAVRMGKYSEAIACYKSSLHLSRALQDAYRESRAVHSLGTTFRNQGHFGEARNYLEQGLQISRQVGDLHSESRSLNSLGDVAYYLGGYTEAQRHFEQVREIAVQLGDRRSQSIAVTNLGIIARDLGAYHHAKELLTQGLYLAGEIGFRRGEAWALVCLSLLLHQEQKESAALESGQQGLRLFRELSDDVGQAYAWTEIGHAFAGLEQWEDAQAAYHQALTMRRALSQPHLEMEVVAGLIRVDLARQELGEAENKAQELFHYLATNRPLGTEEPIHIYWTCYQALRAGPHAQKLLNDAQRLLEERAVAIENESLRRSFLHGIRVHRTVREVWTSSTGTGRLTNLRKR